MKCVKRFESEDGSLFGTQRECRQHENLQEAKRKLAEELRSSISTGRTDAVILEILNNPEPVRNILTELIRKSQVWKPQQQRQAA